VIEFFSRQK